MERSLRSIALVLVLVALVAMASAYTLVSVALTYPSSVSGNVIKIGMPISLSGSLATEGSQSLCGAIATVMWINDNGGVEVGGKTYKLQLVYYDDASSASNEPSLVQMLVTQDNVNFLLAPYGSDLTAAAAPIAEQYHVIMLSHGGASNAIFQEGYHYLVQILSPASAYFTGALEIIKQYIPDAKIAFIYANEKFASTAVQYAEQEASQMGLDVVYSQAYESGTSDFSTFINAAKAKGANVLLGGGHYADGKALVKQAHDLGWHLKFIALLVAPAEPKFYQELGDIANGVAGPSQWEPSVKYSPQIAAQMGLEWFGPTVQEWINYFNKTRSEVSACSNLESPSYHAAEAGAAILFLVKAIEAAGTLNNTEVRQAMNNIDIMTFFGRLKIDPNTGLQIGHEMVIAQWQNGEWVVIWPSEVAQAQPLIAPPNWWPTSTETTSSASTTNVSSTGSPTPSPPPTETTKKISNAVLWGTVIVVIIIVILGAWLAVRR